MCLSAYTSPTNLRLHSCSWGAHEFPILNCFQTRREREPSESLGSFMEPLKFEAIRYGDRMEEHAEISPSCPRCGSSNTKFCYHNNYSLTQPRYFCKGCRRYWTKGGSVRNVPVGGGCRKNRRGKSMRLSTDVRSKILGYGGLSNNSSTHPFSHKGISSTESSSSSMIPDGSHIDLALVYAKFLNPQQDSESGFEMPEFGSEFDQPLEFPNIPTTYLESPDENGLSGSLTISDFSTEVPLTDNDHSMHYYSLDSAHKHQDHQDRTQRCTSHETSSFHFPPLPGQDTASQEILWSNSHMMDNHSLEMSQQPVLGPDTQDPDLLFDNWSPFDMSSDDTFSRS